MQNYAIQPGNVLVKRLKTISTIITYNIKHIQPAKSEKIDYVLIFENRRKMTILGPRDPMGGRNSQISISTTFFHELNHSESF